MDLISHPVYLSHPGLLDPGDNTLQHQACCCNPQNREITVEGEAVSTGGKEQSPEAEDPTKVNKSLHTLTLNIIIIFVFLDEAATATSLKVFRILLIVGWIAACIAVVYVVLFMIRVHAQVYYLLWGIWAIFLGFVSVASFKYFTDYHCDNCIFCGTVVIFV